MDLPNCSFTCYTIDLFVGNVIYRFSRNFIWRVGLRRKLLWVQGAVGRVGKVVGSGEAVRSEGDPLLLILMTLW